VKSAVDGSVQSGVNSCDDITTTQIIAVNYAFTSKRSRVKVSLYTAITLLQHYCLHLATAADNTAAAATSNACDVGSTNTTILAVLQQVASCTQFYFFTLCIVACASSCRHLPTITLLLSA
jgi:hypothetical protein